MMTPQRYYATQSPMTDPKSFAHLYDLIPNDPQSIAKILQGLIVHYLGTRIFDFTLTAEQRKDMNLRSVGQILGRIHELDSAPLTVQREPKARVVGNCRDFAVLFVSICRHFGVPARLRVGFASYIFDNGFNADHWVPEYWSESEQRWIMVEPGLEDERHEKSWRRIDRWDLSTGLGASYLTAESAKNTEVFEREGRENSAQFELSSARLSSNPTKPDFYLAGDAWLRCRRKEAHGRNFGFARWRGLPFIKGNLLHDLQALNKTELLCPDLWGPLMGVRLERLDEADLKKLDQVAQLTLDPDGNFDALRSCHAAWPDTKVIESKLAMFGITDGIKIGDPTILTQQASLQPATSQPATPQPHRSPFGGGNIEIYGARQHNLKNIDVTIPRHKLTVITGVSGSGKSSLAFDTLYAEGQRRYVESLSSYARQFLGQMEKPKVDHISGLSPAVAIEQKTVSKNPRSTVGTITEVSDYMRLLFARVGQPHCPQCGREVHSQSPQQIVNSLLTLPEGTRMQLLAPIVRDRKGTHADSLQRAKGAGFARARVDGEMVSLLDGKLPNLAKTKKHRIELVVDRLVMPAEADRAFRDRLTDSAETALQEADGNLIVLTDDSELLFSQHNACAHCDLSFRELAPNLFSANAPSGMCPDCNGLGIKLQVDPNLIVSQPHLSLLDGASNWYGNLRKKGQSSWTVNTIHNVADHYDVDLELPWQDLPEKFRRVLLYGSDGEKILFTHRPDATDDQWSGQVRREARGIIYHINRLFRQTKSEGRRKYFTQFMSKQTCPTCDGERLCPEARFVTVSGQRLPDVNQMTIQDALAWARGVPAQVTEEQQEIIEEVISELDKRLQFMLNVGLHYLTLDRPAPTLSGGEGQRIRLASQLSSGLVGVLYVLDEPSIGLHARDHHNLIATLEQLRDVGNTVLVVEHDAETMRRADWVIDLGPGAGVLGGEVISSGPPTEIVSNPHSLTGQYLSGAKQITSANAERRSPQGWLTIRGATMHNLKSVTARFPLGVMVCVTGVSGSGKSSLVSKTLTPILSRALHRAKVAPGPHEAVEGLEQLDKAISITQDPIGRTPRSNPATYVGLFDEIRKLFARMPEAKIRGYKAGRFSFNNKEGRCAECQGYGRKRVEMHFLPDIWVLCQECGGQRYNRDTCQILYKGKSIADVLDMDIQEALAFFESQPKIRPILQTLHDVGLNYVKLGQSALTLSGGEAQRVKLAKELSRVDTGRTAYILDEPTTGLHFADIQKLLDVLHRLVDAGNTVIIIEHNLDVVKSADWLIDLGPEGGAGGGTIVAEGTPEQVATNPSSHTGRFL